MFEERVDEIISRMDEMEKRIGKCGDIRRLELRFELDEPPNEDSMAVMTKKYELVKSAEPKPSPVQLPEGYEEVEEGLKKDKEGKHEEAMRLYEEAGKKDNKAAFINMGNCYMFGKGVEEDWKKGIEMYAKCRGICGDERGWIMRLSNDKYVCETKLNLNCLFLFF